MPAIARKRVRERVDRVERRLLVLLHVLVVRERKPLERHEQRLQVAEDAPGLAAHELGEVGVLLLRHDRGAGRELVVHRDEAELVARPQDELLGEAREVHLADRARVGQVEQEVAVADGVHRVLAHRREAEARRHVLAVERVRRAGERRAAERQHVGGVVRVAQAREVAAEHLRVGEQVVAEQHRLRLLQVRVAGHHRAEMLLGEPEQDPAQRRARRRPRSALADLA